MSNSFRMTSLLGGGAGQLALALLGLRAGDLNQDIRLAQDQQILEPDLDLGTTVLREDDLVAEGDVHRDQLSLVVARAGADSQDLAALRLLPGRIRQHDAAHSRLLLLEGLDDQAITKRRQIHGNTPFVVAVAT